MCTAPHLMCLTLWCWMMPPGGLLVAEHQWHRHTLEGAFKALSASASSKFSNSLTAVRGSFHVEWFSNLHNASRLKWWKNISSVLEQTFCSVPTYSVPTDSAKWAWKHPGNSFPEKICRVLEFSFIDDQLPLPSAIKIEATLTDKSQTLTPIYRPIMMKGSLDARWQHMQ